MGLIARNEVARFNFIRDFAEWTLVERPAHRASDVPELKTFQQALTDRNERDDAEVALARASPRDLPLRAGAGGGDFRTNGFTVGQGFHATQHRGSLRYCLDLNQVREGFRVDGVEDLSRSVTAGLFRCFADNCPARGRVYIATGG